VIDEGLNFDRTFVGNDPDNLLSQPVNHYVARLYS